MANNKFKAVEKKPFFGNARKKNGKPARLGTVCVDENGNTGVVLTPAGKGAKYAAELKSGKRYTNAGQTKVGENGKPLGLSKAQRAYRGGYLKARQDNAKAYNAKKAAKKPRQNN